MGLNLYSAGDGVSHNGYSVTEGEGFRVRARVQGGSRFLKLVVLAYPDLRIRKARF
jgi:hypothetical protein